MSLWIAIFEQVRSRRSLLPLVLSLTAGLSALGALQLRFTEDVFELLPQKDPTVVEGRLALTRFRALERIVIDVEAPDTAAVVAGIDQLAAQLAQTPGISKVTSKLSDDALVDIAQAYEGKVPLLFDEAMEARRSSPAGSRSSWKEPRARVASRPLRPSSGVIPLRSRSSCFGALTA